jgi:hypothetical protein
LFQTPENTGFHRHNKMPVAVQPAAEFLPDAPDTRESAPMYFSFLWEKYDITRPFDF